jgi:hypothetical protein
MITKDLLAKLEASMAVRGLSLNTWEAYRSPSGNEQKSNITDPESAKMSSSRGVIQGYNGLAVVDERAQIVVHAEAQGSGYEGHRLVPLLESTRKTFGGPQYREDCGVGSSELSAVGATVPPLNRAESLFADDCALDVTGRVSCRTSPRLLERPGCRSPSGPGTSRGLVSPHETVVALTFRCLRNTIMLSVYYHGKSDANCFLQAP